MKDADPRESFPFPSGVGYQFGKYVPLSELFLSPLDLGVIHGDATYEVARVHNGRLFRPDLHFERFQNSLEGFHLTSPYSQEEITEIWGECVKRSSATDAFVWAAVTRGIPKSGNPRDLDSCENLFFAYAKPYYGLSLTKEDPGMRLTISDTMRVPDASVFQRLKNWHWLDLTSAQRQAQAAETDSAILPDRDENLTEGPGFNFALVMRGHVVTPDHNVLRGTTIQAVEQLCAELNIPFSYKDVSIDDVSESDEAFVTSVSGGITWVPTFGEKTYAGSSGEITRILQNAYKQKLDDPAWTIPLL